MIDKKSYKVVPYHSKRFKDKVLVVSEFQNWLFLTENEFQKLKFLDLDEPLFNKLKENNLIITADNEDKLVQQVNDYNWDLFTGPSLNIIVPTLRCNQTCKYCYAYRVTEDKQGYDMDLETAKKTLDFLFSIPTNIRVIEFTGGEPLLKFDIIKYIVTEAKKIGTEKGQKVLFSIVTNGTLLTDEMIEFFRKYRVGICLSIDGPKKVHDYHRRLNTGKPTYDKVISTLNKLIEKRYPAVNALPVITKYSFDYWKEIVDEYVKLGFQVLRFKYTSHFGFATENWKLLGYEAEEYLNIWRKVIDYMLDLNKKGIMISEQLSTIMLKKILLNKNPGYCELNRPCGAVIGQILVNYDGKIYPCDETRVDEEMSIGTVENTFNEVLNHPTSKTFITMSTNFSFGCEECVYGPYCGTCPFEDYVVNKTLVVNRPGSYRCKIHKGMFDYLFKKLAEDSEAKKYFRIWLNLSGRNYKAVEKGKDWKQEETPDF